jgi:hypothetical protein
MAGSSSEIEIIMGTNCKALALAGVMLLFQSCQKYASSTIGTTPAPSGGSTLCRMQLGIDPNVKQDTIWTISYNAINKPSVISDSMSGFTATADYDISQRIKEISTSRGDQAMFTYNINGLLSEINLGWAGHRERYVFSYTNNIVSKKSYYTDNGSGRDLVLAKEYVYTVINNNITSIKEYNATGELMRTENCSFDIQPNSFKDLSLFSYALLLGADHLIDAETYFDKNLLSKVTVTDNARITTDELVNTYTLNGKQFPVKVVSKYKSGTLNWIFSYR